MSSSRQLGVGGRQASALSKHLVSASRSAFHRAREAFDYPQQWPGVRALVMFVPTQLRLGGTGRLTRARDAADRYNPGLHSTGSWDPERSYASCNNSFSLLDERDGVGFAWGVSEEGRCSVVKALEGIRDRERDTCHRVLPFVNACSQ